VSTIVEGEVARPKRRAKPKPQAPPQTRARAPFFGGIAWIVAVGVLLAGIVAVNVVVLQLNMQFDSLSRERAQLRADNALLRSQLSSASANVRIEDAATTKLGLQAADPLRTTYVHLPAK
jgi:cell division protein FtsL